MSYTGYKITRLNKLLSLLVVSFILYSSSSLAVVSLDGPDQASSSAIDTFVKGNADGAGGMPMVDSRMPYTAANEKFCISGDCKDLINGYMISGGAIRTSKEGTAAVKVDIDGCTFRGSSCVKFSLSVKNENIFNLKAEKYFPLCEARCTSFKIHAKTGEAILLMFIERDGVKNNKLYLNVDTKSEADGGLLIKQMDDYYEKHGRSLVKKELDPKEESEESTENSTNLNSEYDKIED